jgi:hypothetical protein
MKLALDPDVPKLIDQRGKSDRYATPEDVVAAAVLSLDQREQFGDFAPGKNPPSQPSSTNTWERPNQF